MAKLRKGQIKKIFLPSYEDLPEEDRAWVEVECSTQMIDFEDVDQSQSELRSTAQILVKKIKSWNLVTDDEKPMPITVENVVSLDSADFASLTIAVGLQRLQRLTSQKKMP